MRFSDSQYASADFINRWARGAMAFVILLAIGTAVVLSAFGDDETEVAVLSAQADSLTPTSVTLAPFGDLVLGLTDNTTTTVSDSRFDTGRTPGVTSTTSTTSAPPSPTTTTTTLASTTTTRPATTTSTSTTLPPTTTTSTTSTTTTSTTTSTTTTTLPPAEDLVFLEDLSGSADPSGPGWTASVRVTIDSTDSRANLRDAFVTGAWSGAHVGIVSGSPNRQGRVIFETPPLLTGRSVTFRVISIVHPDYPYDPKLNEDSDTITIEFDGDDLSVAFAQLIR